MLKKLLLKLLGISEQDWNTISMWMNIIGSIILGSGLLPTKDSRKAALSWMSEFGPRLHELNKKNKVAAKAVLHAMDKELTSQEVSNVR